MFITRIRGVIYFLKKVAEKFAITEKESTFAVY